MLLRASAQKESIKVNLNAVTDGSNAAGIAFDHVLGELTEALINGDKTSLIAQRNRACREMGELLTVDALGIASAFNGITRVADSTGIPLDPETSNQTVDIRNQARIDEFDYAAKSSRYDAG
jgi:hypothetical protein|tara:strand:+ start:1348 stop:1713 length:366 start_codon:yes stop_codon:yes gene_type:complete